MTDDFQYTISSSNTPRNTISEMKVHEHGFVKLVEVMGSDNSIEDAARVSYGAGTRKSSDTRNLIRYLMRHGHTTPFEMAVVRFHIKLPIFVMRQHIRHRTASVNEYSGRYSEMSSDFYVPEVTHIGKQSEANKQGRDDGLEPLLKQDIKRWIEVANITADDSYRSLLKDNLARETARIVLPVSNYTECFWQMNLHNLFHYLKLRTDSHAQQEIQDYANAILELSKPHFPLSFEAWEDYSKNTKVLSRMEQKLCFDLVIGSGAEISIKSGTYLNTELFEMFGKEYNMSKREWDEFFKWYDKGRIE